jgi:hypothetical protein
MRRVVPGSVATAVAVVLTAVPPPDGVSVTVTPPGEIVPLGKPLPVTLIVEIPACPLEGEAGLLRVTCPCAQAAPTVPNSTSSAIRPKA